MSILGFNFDLREQLVFYGSYHSKPGNQVIHFIFVPLILWTVGVWLAYAPPIGIQIDVNPMLHALFESVPLWLTRYMLFDWSFALFAAYGLYYILLEPFAGITWAIAVAFPLWTTAEAFKQLTPSAWMVSIVLHILSWAIQVYWGHAVIEKRRPALMDSFFQSLVLAPLFVWFEFLFLFNYRPQLRKDVVEGSTAHINAWKKAGLQKAA